MLVLGVLLLLVVPCIAYAIKKLDFTYLITSSLFALPPATIVLLLKNKHIVSIGLGVLTLFSLAELILVLDLGSFMLAGNILATLTTTPEESASFAKNAIYMLWYIVPIIGFFIGLIYVIHHTKINVVYHGVILGISILLIVSFIGYKQVIFYNNTLTNRYYIEHRILNRPPYNMFYQIHNIIKGQRIRQYIKDANNMSFGATKQDTLHEKEIYVLGIGESMRYDNLSLNGKYYRSTTPKLETMKNIILYDNYYSSACLTMYSVPQILTRATPLDYELNFKEKSIFLPFKECGFHTYGIVCHNLLSYETYLTDGVDSLFLVDSDAQIPIIIDSLSNIYSKTFFIVQFLGNHSFYYNFTPEYDVYHPNSETDKDATNVSRSTLLINSYDNTILYADYILSEIMCRINKSDAVSAFLFVSDHGEIQGEDTLDGGNFGHGGNCNPIRAEYHVPLIVWYSELYKSTYPEKVNQLLNHKANKVNSDNVFYSVCDMANIQIAQPYAKQKWSIFSKDLQFHTRYILVPDGINYKRVE